ncbi:hypothetical protein BU15DRAFT_79001 [Melanogaster broomeanus]|nr:hypothetical protein BU15DRAFT_79001 [Melanogaster broomeanus]
MSKRPRPSLDSEFDEDRRIGRIFTSPSHATVNPPLPVVASASSSPAVAQSPIPWELSADDFHFSLLIAAALEDHREMKWYGVWDMALRDYLFHGCNTATMTCSIMPQYSLVATYDTYDKAKDDWEAYLENAEPGSVASPNSPPSRGPTRGVSDSPDPILLVPKSHRMDTLVRASSLSRDAVSPRTPMSPDEPNPGVETILRRSTRVPDIAAVLHFSASPFSHGALPELHGDRVILIVEIKPALMAESGRAFEEIIQQVHAQARHAFHEDENLKAVGAIMAFGNRWRYTLIQREHNPPRSWSEERDPTYHGDSNDADESDDADDLPTFEANSESEDSEPEEAARPEIFLPRQFQAQLLGQEFELLDSEGLFLVAFQAIIENLKQMNTDIWK